MPKLSDYHGSDLKIWNFKLNQENSPSIKTKTNETHKPSIVVVDGIALPLWLWACVCNFDTHFIVGRGRRWRPTDGSTTRWRTPLSLFALPFQTLPTDTLQAVVHAETWVVFGDVTKSSGDVNNRPGVCGGARDLNIL
jgi:hypothetical protein